MRFEFNLAGFETNVMCYHRMDIGLYSMVLKDKDFFGLKYFRTFVMGFVPPVNMAFTPPPP